MVRVKSDLTGLQALQGRQASKVLRGSPVSLACRETVVPRDLSVYLELLVLQDLRVYQGSVEPRVLVVLQETLEDQDLSDLTDQMVQLDHREH